LLRKLVFPISLSLLLNSGWSAFAQSQPPVPDGAIRASAFIAPQPVQGEKDLSFQAVLFSSLRIELERSGLEVRVLEEAELASLAQADLKTLLERAGGAGTDFLFVESYTSHVQELRVEIVTYGVEEADRMASVFFRGRIGLRLDEAVTQAANKLLPLLKARIALAVQRRKEALAAQPPVEVALAEQAQPAGEPPSGPQPPSPAEPAGPVAPPAAEPGTGEAAGEQAMPPEPVSATAARPEPLPAQPQRPLDWQVAAGAASFFPLPALSDAVSLGILSTVYLERLLSTSIGTLGLGLYAGFTTFMPAGAGLAAYFQSLIPVGLDLRWTAFERSRLGLFVRLLGGAAVNVSDQSKVAGRLTRVLPQLKAGAGLTLALSRRVGISVEFLYEMLFYLYTVDGGVANDLIMGFNAPAICVYTKW
jgi:hypothetical protein